MNQISKPHIVDLLRIFDKNRYINPRIRYASVRSKPELLNDLKMHFRVRIVDEKKKRFIHLDPVIVIPRLPKKFYSVPEKKFYFDDSPVDVPSQSRERPSFHVRKGPVTLYFDLPKVKVDRPGLLSK